MVLVVMLCWMLFSSFFLACLLCFLLFQCDAFIKSNRDDIVSLLQIDDLESALDAVAAEAEADDIQPTSSTKTAPSAADAVCSSQFLFLFIYLFLLSTIHPPYSTLTTIHQFLTTQIFVNTIQNSHNERSGPPILS
jgi:hypothetical protein